MSAYVGRFAPTPSGSLHFGSLVAALGSYLRARNLQGSWHLRIDDIDTVRCPQGSAQNIITTLKNYGFKWDGPILVQSERLPIYERYLLALNTKALTYGCDCTRAMLKGSNGIYHGHCRELKLPPEAPHAIRLKSPEFSEDFCDVLRGPISLPHELWTDDFILKRRDGIFGYNFVTVIDDYETGVTEVVRGIDILESTPRQINLYKLLGLAEPKWLHLPLALEANGLKLSKQNHAEAIPKNYTPELMLEALRFLGQDTDPTMLSLSPDKFLNKAAQVFDIKKIPLTDKLVTKF